MLKIADLINRYTKLTVPDGILRAKVSELIMREIGFDIPVDKITVRRKIAFVNCSPAIKCELQIRKEKILSSLMDELGKDAPIDIS
ncbi:MAG: hypothetical protein HZA95_03585 [Candidatus Vogelbacteria bacterium]|nr:hypothetical protein [Candidatus Vogelbacteria bacterium]